MECWSKHEIALPGQIYFIGYSLSICLLWGPELVGRAGFLKKCVVPLLAIHHFLEVFAPTHYFLNSVSFFLNGITRMRMMNAIQNCTEQIPKSHASLVSGTCYLLETAAVFLLSLYLKSVSNDAVRYVNIYGMTTLSMALCFLFMATESPKWLIMNGKHNQALKSFNYIARVNSALTLDP